MPVSAVFGKDFIYDQPCAHEANTKSYPSDILLTIVFYFYLGEPLLPSYLPNQLSARKPLFCSLACFPGEAMLKQPAVAHEVVGGQEPRVLSSGFPHRVWQLEESRGTSLSQQRERSANMILHKEYRPLFGPSSQQLIYLLENTLCLSEKSALEGLFGTTAYFRDPVDHIFPSGPRRLTSLASFRELPRVRP